MKYQMKGEESGKKVSLVEKSEQIKDHRQKRLWFHLGARMES